jgi:uncharacterized protein (TIGR02596 family)
MKQFRNHSAARLPHAFTLVEMLTVVGIIALLVALVTPTLVDVIRSTRLNSSGDSLVNRLSLAQQSAVARSSEVEMRFYKYIDPDSDQPTVDHYYAYQVVEMPNGGKPQPLSEVYYLDSGILISKSGTYSPLLETSAPQMPLEAGGSQYLFSPNTGVGGGSVEYAALRFYADGSCRVLNSETPGNTAVAMALAYTVPPLAESFMTVMESRYVDSASVPQNFYCLQIDSYTGKVRTYRP